VKPGYRSDRQDIRPRLEVIGTCFERGCKSVLWHTGFKATSSECNVVTALNQHLEGVWM
jgi:hypothetical protein